MQGLAMQCAAIPYRRAQSGDLEILLVTSRSKGNWILPKGKVKPGKTAALSAQEEVYEEAGALGVVDQALVARFDLSVTGKDDGAVREEMQVFSLEVESLALVWPEMFQRQRRWVSVPDALEAIRNARIRKALRDFAMMMAPII
jgi:8-oxo-dGTP pyrophosphatase MutT (NUDIX family)